jgi:hypothetical protein
MAATADLSVTSAATDMALAPPLFEPSDRSCRLRLIASDDGNRRPGFRKPACHAKADAAVAAGHDRHLAAEIE